MSNHLTALLDQWRERRDQCQWVLGTVYDTRGPSYRKAGAMMLFNDLGEMFGLLSGGCLEGDIQHHAKVVMASGEARTLVYDGSDEDDIAYQLGIGCGGTVYILLQPVNAANHYLCLDKLDAMLQSQSRGHYYQQIPQHSRESRNYLFAAGESIPVALPVHDDCQQARLHTSPGNQWLVTPVLPAPELLIVGGGVDARPVAAMAAQQGWRVRVCDPRPANGRRHYFPDACQLLNCRPAQLAQQAFFGRLDAVVVMSHNLALDAEAIATVQPLALKYLGLLGPQSRKHRVLAMAGFAESTLTTPLCGPVGLDIGGELPESLALSIIAQCHAHLHGKAGRGVAPTMRGQHRPPEVVNG